MLSRSSMVAGIDIQAHEVRLVKVRQIQGQPQLIFHKIVPVSTGIIAEGQIKNFDAIYTILEELLSKAETKDLRIIVSLPQQSMITHQVYIPGSLSSQELKSEIDNHFIHFFPGMAQELIFDYVILNKKKGNTEVLIFAVKLRLLNEYCEMFKAVGWKVKAIDSSLLALIRAMKSVSQNNCIAILEVNEPYVCWMILNESFLISQEQWPMLQVQAFQKKISQSIHAWQYENPNKPITHLYLVGNAQCNSDFLSLQEELFITLSDGSQLFLQMKPLSVSISNRLLASYGLTFWQP